MAPHVQEETITYYNLALNTCLSTIFVFFFLVSVLFFVLDAKINRLCFYSQSLNLLTIYQLLGSMDFILINNAL